MRMGLEGSGQTRTPGERAGFPGVGIQVPAKEEPAFQGLVVVFMTLDQLRACGPMGLRMWLERNRPARRALSRDAGEVVEFNPGPLGPVEAKR
jgi:hypothetical protein